MPTLGKAVHEQAFAKIHLEQSVLGKMKANVPTTPAQMDEYKKMLKEMKTTFRDGLTKDLAWRKQQLRQLIKLCIENTEEIVAAVGADLGGPKMRGVFEMGCVEQARYAIAHLDSWAADESVSFGSPFGSNRIRRSPKGVVLSISTELALPMGIGVDEGNTITHMVEGGNAHADGMLQVDDRVISV